MEKREFIEGIIELRNELKSEQEASMKMIQAMKSKDETKFWGYILEGIMGMTEEDWMTFIELPIMNWVCHLDDEELDKVASTLGITSETMVENLDKVFGELVQTEEEKEED